MKKLAKNIFAVVLSLVIVATMFAMAACGVSQEEVDFVISSANTPFVLGKVAVPKTFLVSSFVPIVAFVDALGVGGNTHFVATLGFYNVTAVLACVCPSRRGGKVVRPSVHGTSAKRGFAFQQFA
mgnify:CR=1 FL=1